MLLALCTVALSLYVFIVRRRADRHLAELLKKHARDSGDDYSEQVLERIKSIEARLQESTLGPAEKRLLAQQLTILRLEPLEDKVLKLSEHLSGAEREKILDTLSQASERGKLNYLTGLLEQSRAIEGVH